MTDSFNDKNPWYVVYNKIGQEVLKYRNDRKKLLDIVASIRNAGLKTISLKDIDFNDSVIELSDIDPFTFFASFNRGIEGVPFWQKKVKIVLEKLQLNTPEPTDNHGIPTVFATNAWFFPYKKYRKEDDIETLWNLFSQAIKTPDEIKEETYKRSLGVKYVGAIKLSMGLFWINSEKFLSLDTNTLDYIKKHGKLSIETKKMSLDRYLEINSDVKEAFINKSFMDICFEAYNQEDSIEESNQKRIWRISPSQGAKYWHFFQKKSVIAIGWNDVGDLNEFDQEEDFRRKFHDVFTNSRSYPQVSTFYYNIEIGDLVVAYGGTSILGIGEITGDYYFKDNDDFDYYHRKNVKWFELDDIPKFVTGNILNFLSKNKTIYEIDDSKTIQLVNDLIFGKTTTRNYYMVVISPDSWDWSILEKNNETSWNDRRYTIQTDIKTAKNGDIVLGYTSGHRQIECLAKMARDSYQTQEGFWTFDLRYLKRIKNPIQLSEIKAIDSLRSSKAVKMKFRATMIHLENWEYNDYRNLILKKNPDLESVLPMEKDIESIELYDRNCKKIFSLLEHKKQLILIGPPGTGKTYLAKEFAEQFSSKPYKFIQFHPSYSYEDFIEGIRPILTESANSSIQFELKNGLFKEMCIEAKNELNLNFVLIIDEINRGNLSKILGEVFSILEYRNDEILLPYSLESFTIPENLYIIGTMNTADRSIALIDFALRRRFMFMELMPDYDFLKFWLLENGGDIELTELVTKALEGLNGKIIEELDKNHQIGHTYFMISNLDYTKLLICWKHSIIPLLEEYFYRDDRKINQILRNVSKESEDSQNWRDPDKKGLMDILYRLSESND